MVNNNLQEDNLILMLAEQDYSIASQYKPESSISEDITLAIALSLSEINPTSEESLTIYIDNLQNGDIISAENLYHNLSEKSKSVIDALLDTIPWRVSTEYRYDGKNVHWTNSSVKIGWFPPTMSETSPMLYNGTWVNNNIKLGVHFSEFKTSVWQGKGAAMIHKLLSLGSPVNVKLTFNPNYKLYIISDVAFHGFDEATETLDLAIIDIGSLTSPSTSELLDDLRIHYKTIVNSDGTIHKLFSGSTLGLYLIDDMDMYGIDGS